MGREVNPFCVTNNELIDAPREHGAKCLDFRNDSVQSNIDKLTGGDHCRDVFLAFTYILYHTIRFIVQISLN